MKILFIFLVFLLFFSETFATIWTVNDDGTAQFTKIQDAVDTTSIGDTVFVYNGMYPESILLKQGIVLLGQNNDSTTIKGSLNATAGNCIIENFNISPIDSIASIGIYFDFFSTNLDSCFLTIKKNKISGFVTGIGFSGHLDKDFFALVENNLFQNNETAIILSEINSIDIANNNIQDNNQGISVNSSPLWSIHNWDIRIYGNNITNNFDGIILGGVYCTGSPCFEDSVIFNATENWWGTQVESEIENQIHNNHERIVNYNNWLMSEIQTGIERQENGIHKNNIVNDTWNIYIEADPTSINPATEKSPGAFLLQQNYPNPFNSSTHIAYYLDKPGFVQLSIYDQLGKLVAKLVNQYQLSGSYKILWDGNDYNNLSVSTGLYYYRITNGYNSSSMKKMLLLK